MFWDRYDNYDPFFGVPAQRQPRKPARVVRPADQHYYDEDMLDMSGWPFMRQSARKARPAPRPRAPVRPKPKRREITLEEAEAAAILLQSAFRTHRVQRNKVLPNMRALAKSQKSVQDSIRRFTAKLSNKTRTAEQTRFCYATFAEELTREMLNLDKITTYNETVVREKRKALVRRIQTLLSEVDGELPKWEKLAAEELAERRRLKEAQRQAEEDARERAAEEEMMRRIQVQTSDEEDFSEEEEEEDVEMFDSEVEETPQCEYDSEEYDSEDESDAMQVEGDLPRRAKEIMEELQFLQEEADSIEKERQQLMDALEHCERKKAANFERQSGARSELEASGWLDGRA